jgi:hypothetical protein
MSKYIALRERKRFLDKLSKRREPLSNGPLSIGDAIGVLKFFRDVPALRQTTRRERSPALVL